VTCPIKALGSSVAPLLYFSATGLWAAPALAAGAQHIKNSVQNLAHVNRAIASVGGGVGRWDNALDNPHAASVGLVPRSLSLNDRRSQSGVPGFAVSSHRSKIVEMSVARADVDLFTASIYVVGVLLEHLLKKILFYHRYNEFTDKLTHAHTPELCLER